MLNTVLKEEKKIYREEDLLELSARGRYELVKGEIVEMTPSGFEHGLITSKLHYFLSAYVYKKDLGVLTAAETGFKTGSDPDTVRAADIAFLSKEKMEKSSIIKGYSTIIPDLVVEVISPYDIYLDVEEKIAEWLSGGVRAVWVVNPRKKTVKVYKENITETFSVNDELTGDDILPGFKCKVGEIFI